MLIVITVFKYGEDGPTDPPPAALAAIQDANDHVKEVFVDTGKMLWFYQGMKFIGTEVAGQHWDDAAIYALRDLDAMRDWMMWEKHRNIDLAMAATNSYKAVLPLQFTDGDEDREEALKIFADILREGAIDRAEHGQIIDFAYARLGAEYAVPNLESYVPAS